MAEGIVDLLEAIEVKHQHADAAVTRRPLGEGAGERQLEAGAVGQVGEVVVQRLVLGLGAAGVEGTGFAVQLQQ